MLSASISKKSLFERIGSRCHEDNWTLATFAVLLGLKVPKLQEMWKGCDEAALDEIIALHTNRARGN